MAYKLLHEMQDEWFVVPNATCENQAGRRAADRGRLRWDGSFLREKSMYRDYTLMAVTWSVVGTR